MALGTTLSATLDASTTAGLQDLVFTSDGIAATQVVIDSGGILTICIMSYHFDYSNNAPALGGDFHQTRVWYMEMGGARRPRLSINESGETGQIVFAEDSGNDDDARLANTTNDPSVNWSTIRGDITTSGSEYDASINNSYTAVYTRSIPGRGGAELIENMRSYFAFDLSGVTLTPDSVVMNLFIDSYSTAGGDFPKLIAVQATALAGSTADYGNCFVADAVAVADNATFFGANF